MQDIELLTTVTGDNLFASAEIRSVFRDYLNMVYCSKSHLVERFDDVASGEYFIDIRESMVNTLRHTQKNLTKIDELYEFLGWEPYLRQQVNITAVLEDTFYDIEQNARKPLIRNLHLLKYLQFISDLEKSGSNMLLLIAGQTVIEALMDRLLHCLVPVVVKSGLRSLLADNLSVQA